MDDRNRKDPASAAKAIIDCSFADRQELQEKLCSLGVTRRHLTELFEYKYGMSPKQYADRVRFERSKDLLDDGSMVTDVAFEVGMESSASFATFFKKYAGITPTEYLSQQKQDHRQKRDHLYCFFKTPLGMMRMEEDPDGITSLKFADYKTEEEGPGRSCTYLNDAMAQLAEYFKGARKTFDIPLSIRGSEFQMRVWKALRDIPYGETRCYSEVAEAVGNPKASRAVGMANNRNPVLIMIPCHRVIGKSGKPVGYAGGVERKERLLGMEAEQM